MNRVFNTSLALVLGLAFSACDVSDPPAVPPGYERFFSDAPHNFRVGRADRGDPVRRGALSERFELRDGDCGGSDCGNPRHRAEIRQSPGTSTAQVGRPIWYGWSFYNLNVPSYSREDSLRLVFGQWTMGGDANPALRLIQLGDGEGHWSDCDPAFCVGPETRSGDIALQLEDLHQTFDWGKRENDGYVCRLFDLADNRGQWVDLVMTTNFSAGPDGYVRIWVNDVLKCDYSGPIVTSNSLVEGLSPEHRRGVFSSYTLRWDASRGGQVKPRKVVYYDEFQSGQRRADVDVRLREASGLPPVD